ncbi:MAG: tRNA guanosine(34) transglycosylase Tgt [Phycisphaerales bacterium]|nr:tRNA guanosine(34) transglycosylase Tgt [Phycisphaerales bacterium]
MTSPLSFSVDTRCTSTAARTGRVETPHGGFDTPAFMPVGTRASVKGLLPQQVADTGSQILLNNAYHLMLRPGDDMIAARGGVHAFMRWNGPILTDSGGYQAFSMSDINAIDDEGVTFKSIIDGARVHLGPERAMEVQNNLGADIIMAFDDCPPAAEGDPGDHKAAEAFRRRLETAVDRTTRWLERCVAAHRRSSDQALFGIVQGGPHEDLREASVKAITSIDLPGYAIGGVATGEPTDVLHRIVAHTAPLLPQDKPRYLMGVGYERDLVAAVRAGVDMFDCVLPTRNGRNAGAFTRTGRIQLRNACFREDDGVIDPGCDCTACSGGFSRAYLRHLFVSGEMLGPILLSQHNLRHFQRLMLDIRGAIREDAWSSLYRAWPVLDQDQPAAPTPVDPPSKPSD